MSEYLKRIVISNVQPVVDDGNYPAKATAGKPIRISADVFTYGNDAIACQVLVKHSKERKWNSYAMMPEGNDVWSVEYLPEHTGEIFFRLEAWEDLFSTWLNGTNKKLVAGQDVGQELLLLQEMSEKMLLTIKNASEKKKLSGVLDAFIAGIKNDTIISSDDSALLRAAFDKSGKKNSVSASKTFSIFCERLKSEFSTWYELFPRSTGKDKEHGTFSDVIGILPRIAAMGFDTLYFPPIHPIGQSKRKGRNNSLTASENDPGSPWAIGSKEGGHKSIHRELGTMNEFRRLVKSAAQLNIEIALDIAFQCSPDHPYIKEHPEWFRWRPDGSIQYAENPPKKYEDIVPFYFESDNNEALYEELKSIFVYWIEHGITVFRVDNPHTKPFSLWEFIISSIRKDHPEVIFLAEAFTRPRIMEQLAKIGFTQSYTYFTWRNTKSEIEEYMRELVSVPVKNFFRPNFWPNTPDILPPYLTAGGENAHIIRLILAATLSSSYGIYGPVYEFNLHTPVEGKEEYIDNEKYEIHSWDWTCETKISEIITSVNRIRKENKAFHLTDNIQFAKTTNEQLICYAKISSDLSERFIIAVNLDPFNTQEATVHLPMKFLGLHSQEYYIVHDLLSGEKYMWHGDSNYVKLNPHDLPAHIFKISTRSHQHE